MLKDGGWLVPLCPPCESTREHLGGHYETDGAGLSDPSVD